MPEETRRKISQSETGNKRSPEVGKKISATKLKRKAERLANTLSNGSKIDSNELSNENGEITHFNI